ncbi:bifunctional 4-hydroxy-2-oxoglutarate aldolase/2-dehydro-3-deoxy-phosphogluconate aldolase [Roseiconus nitratireducens]|uniref:2-dehydro-3-deoxy-phosphogluconate aldolase n=1 Tax=Roseiconus nitratireducens TaxID=2605748 RepID=A0A5M6DF73_9BACT|nr:bifunctional 4-hydroxy-2-oxoglutarate aldolase/2-dehydro-3-deoxy-phosphogluconate aldolase [Roseiconus nitratireducens]KAA5543845.1 bifunctional 4-hydroxy-2-oxoglutarate aldolase/2-dehydro-3-deoxy-phosphogluconate aldolase [Roseiconus nitratireducens]
MFPAALLQRLYDAGFVAVLTIENLADAVPLAEALMDGGVHAMELTLRTPVAVQALEAIRDQVPEMIAGAGTVLTPDQIRQVRAAGAEFAVAPGMNPRVVAAAAEASLPFAPGICTPSELELAYEQGCQTLKFFPAEPIGGLHYLKSIAAPLRHLGIRFIPLGGIDAENMEAYLRHPLVHAVGGSWVTPPSCLAEQDWKSISRLAARASTIVQRVRNDLRDHVEANR